MTIYIIDFARAVFPVDISKKHFCLLNHLQGQNHQAKLTSLIGLHPWLDKIKERCGDTDVEFKTLCFFLF